MKRPALIFDFGNVLAFFDFEKATTKLGSRLGLSGQELYDRLGPLGFKQRLQEYESGRISAITFGEQVSGLIQLVISHEEFAAAWSDIFTANESIIPVVESLKSQGYRLILGSNTNDLHATHFRKQFAATLAHFDRLILSYEVGHLKPSRDFYHACAVAADSLPEDCVFIDDMPENIGGARAAGLVGLCYQNTRQLIDELDQLGVRVPF